MWYDFGGNTGLGYDINSTDVFSSGGGFGGGSTSGGGINSGGLLDGLFGLAGTYLQADAAIKMQQAASGSRYVEGQPVVVDQRAAVPGAGLTIPPGMLLIGGLVAVVMLARS